MRFTVGILLVTLTRLPQLHPTAATAAVSADVSPAVTMVFARNPDAVGGDVTDVAGAPPGLTLTVDLGNS